jgi:hypothetical protein
MNNDIYVVFPHQPIWAYDKAANVMPRGNLVGISKELKINS